MLSSKINSHHASDEGHDHLVLDFDNVLGKGKDYRSLLSGEGDGIFCVEEVALFRSVFLDQRKIC